MAFGHCGLICQRWVEVVVVVCHCCHQDGNIGPLHCGFVVEVVMVVVGGVGWTIEQA